MNRFKLGFVVLALLLLAVVLVPVAALAAPPCQAVKDNGDIERAAEGILGESGSFGAHDIARATRYPRFGLRSLGHGRVSVRALRFRGPAGLGGSGTIQHWRYADKALKAGCPAVLKLMPVQRSRRCWPSYTPSGPGYACQTRWWPMNGKNCHSNSEGFTCNWITRKFNLGEPLRVHVPTGAKRAVRAYVEVPDYILPGECICTTHGLPSQGFGDTNTLLLR
jgi:hypothetical protein